MLQYQRPRPGSVAWVPSGSVLPVSIIRPWSLIFSRTKSPCGRPYYDLVANFLMLHFPMWSLIMTWLLISFWDLQQKLPKISTVSGCNQTKRAKIKFLSKDRPEYTPHVCQNWLVSNYDVKNLPIWSVILCWSLICFWCKPPCGRQFEYGLIFKTGKYLPYSIHSEKKINVKSHSKVESAQSEVPNSVSIM